jgi:2-polyprenyl-3-methyl-5-hydroxy-6-metoxy-1,4-benzoquinol methylase
VPRNATREDELTFLKQTKVFGASGMVLGGHGSLYDEVAPLTRRHCHRFLLLENALVPLKWPRGARGANARPPAGGPEDSTRTRSSCTTVRRHGAPAQHLRVDRVEHRGAGRLRTLSKRSVDCYAECWACGCPGARPLPRYSNLLYGCPACGFAFQPQRSADDLSTFYDSDYFASLDLGAVAASNRTLEAQIRVELVARQRGRGRLLEIGSAGGHFLAAARHAGFDVVGVEPSLETAQAAMERFGVTVRVAGIEDVELELDAFDVACAWHSLEHIAQPLASLRRIRSCLRPGGMLFVEVPNFDSIRSHREGPKWPAILAYHVGHYGPASLGALLRRAGFEEIHTETVPFAVYRRGLRRVLSYAKHAAILRSSPLGSHPMKHELLRAVAVRLA